jgi:uncharacterized membrane protein (GlpM family)
MLDCGRGVHGTWERPAGREASVAPAVKYLLYFVLGGGLVTAVTALGSQKKGFLAAFLANLPTFTLITFLTIYHHAGTEGALAYARGLLWMTAPWLVYVFCVFFLTGRVGFQASLATGVALYVLLSFLLIRAH